MLVASFRYDDSKTCSDTSAMGFDFVSEPLLNITRRTVFVPPCDLMIATSVNAISSDLYGLSTPLAVVGRSISEKAKIVGFCGPIYTFNDVAGLLQWLPGRYKNAVYLRGNIVSVDLSKVMPGISDLCVYDVEYSRCFSKNFLSIYSSVKRLLFFSRNTALTFSKLAGSIHPIDAVTISMSKSIDSVLQMDCRRLVSSYKNHKSVMDLLYSTKEYVGE